MPLRLPTFQSEDTLSHADDLEFSNQVETGISTLGFQQTVDQGIAALGHIYNAGMQATGLGQQQQPPPMPEQAPLPVVVSPRPTITPLQISQPAQGDQPWTSPSSQPLRTSSEPDAANATLSGNSFTTPTSVDSTTAPGSQPTPSAMSGPQQSLAPSPSPTTQNQATSSPTPTSQTTSYSNIADAAASKYNVDPNVVRGIIQQESSGDPGAVNAGSGAAGLMGLMPGTARELGVDPRNPAAAIDGGVRYLRQMLDQFGGDYTKALAAYNWGPGNVAKWAGDLASLPDETRTYLQSILSPRGDQNGATSGTAAPDSGVAGTASAPGASVGTTPNQPRGAYAGLYTQQNLANGGDPDAWAKCGPVAAFQAAALLGRTPTPSEVEALAQSAGWTGQRGMAGFQSETKLLQSMGIAAKPVDGVDWGHVIADVQRGNPVILQLPGHEGHYITAQGFDPQTGKIDFGSTVGDLTAAKHQTQFTPTELENLGWGTPTASLYLDNPATPSPSVVAGASTTPAASAPTPTGSSASDQPMSYRLPLGASPALNDASSSTGGVSDASAPPGSAYPSSGAGGFADDYTQNGQVSPWTATGTTATGRASESTGTSTPLGLNESPVGVASSSSLTLPDATSPQTQAIPNEDSTSYPIPDYRAPASPLVTAPDQNAGLSPPPSPYDQQQAASMEPAPDRLSAPSSSPLQPVWDAAGNVIGAIHTGAQAVANSQPVQDITQAASTAAAESDAAYAERQRGRAQQSPQQQQVAHALQQGLLPNLTNVTDYLAQTGLNPQDFNRAVDVARGVLNAVPAATADVIDAALTPIGLNGDNVSYTADLPLVGPVKIRPADVIMNLPLPGKAGEALNVLGAAGPLPFGRAVGGPAAGLVAGALENIGDRGATAVRGALQSGAERVSGAVRGIGENLAANAERTVALDAERAGQGSVSAPGVFGIGAPGTPEDAVGRSRFVPPEVRMQTTPNMEIPDDPRLAQAVEAAGGTISDRGIEIHTTRAQDEAAAGRTATRGGVFAEAVPPGGRSSYAKDTPSAGGVGGNQVIPPTPTLYRKPIVLDSEPGTAEGFNQAMERLGTGSNPQVAEAQRALDEAMAAEHKLRTQADYYYSENPGKTWSDLAREHPEFGQRYGDAQYASEDARYNLRQVQDKFPVANDRNVSDAIIAARNANPKGSPARAQALKDLVSRYGGDPSLIDPLLQIRGADHAESAWAIKENIVSTNARKQGYDGVFTIKEGEANANAVNQHPLVVAANQKLKEVGDLWAAARDARLAREKVLDPKGMQPHLMPNDAEWAASQSRIRNLEGVYQDAQQGVLKAEQEAERLLSGHRIAEILDVQQSHNPTPGAPNPGRAAELQRQVSAAQDRFYQLDTQQYQHPRGTPERAAIESEMARVHQEWDAAAEALKTAYNPAPGYTLHPDVMPKPTPADASGSTTAAATAGIMPVPVRQHTDVLASVNKALSQGAASAISGGVGAATNQQLNPDDPNAALKGFAVGAVAPYAITRGAGALARRAGREAGQTEGALAVLGNAPGPRKFTDPAAALAASHGAIGVPEPISPNAGTGRAEAVRRWIVRQGTDNKVDLAKLQQDAQRTLGRPLTAEEMILEQSRVNPSGTSKVMIDERIKPVLQGLDDSAPVVTLPGGKSLTQRSALTQAMVLTNNRDVAVALNAPDRVFSGGLTGADSEAALQHLISNIAPEDQRAVAGGMRDLNSVVETYRQKLVDAGVWTQAFADEMRAKYPNWVPTKILDYMADADKGGAVGTKSISMRDPGVHAYTLEGTLKSREDPIASLVRYVDESEKRIQQNEVFNGFANLYDALKANPDSGWANMVKEVPNSATAVAGRGERTIQGFVNGERKTFIASPSVAAAVKMEQGAQIPIIREVTSLFRELITRTPMFVAGQIPLDAMAAIVRTSNLEGGPQHAPRVAAEVVKGYAEAFRGLLSNEFKGDAARYMKEGGAMAGFYERGINAAHHTVDDLTRRSMFEINNAGDAANLAKWLAGGGWVQAVGQRVELAPRIAAFRLGEQRALRAGADPAKAALEGTMAGRNVTMDFQVGGAASKVINQAVPFFNVGVQSSVTLARMARENPKAFPFTMAALVAAPTVAAEAWNRSDPQRAADYADVPDYIKDRGIVFMLPGVQGTGRLGERKPNYAIIPLRELAPISILTRELAANAMRASGMSGQDDPRGWGALLGGAISAASPIQANSAADLLSSVNPVGLNTGLQLATNQDYFRGRQISTKRNDENASALSKGIAGGASAVTGKDIHPSQVEFGIRDTTGGVGAGALAASDLATGRTKQEQRIQNTPVVGGLINRFVGDASGGNLQRAQAKMRSPELDRLAKSAGISPDALVGVDSMAGQIPLTQQEQARAQVLMNGYLADLMKRGVTSGPQWDASSPEAKQNYVRGLVTAARASAESQVAGPISPADRQRRVDAMKKAG